MEDKLPGLRGEGGRRMNKEGVTRTTVGKTVRFSFSIGEGKLVGDQCLARFTLHHSDYRNAPFYCSSNLTGSLTFAESPSLPTQSIYAQIQLFLAFVLNCLTPEKGIGMFQNVGNLLLACVIQHPK